MRSFSRRGLVKGAAISGAVVAAASLSGCGPEDGADVKGEPEVVTDESKIINVIDEYKNVDCPLNAQMSWDLPLGTVVAQSEGAWAAVIEAPASARAVNTLGVVSLANGARTVLIDAPTQGRGFGFHDVCCSESVFAWAEMNYRTGEWVLLAQALENGALTGKFAELDRGDKDWEPPRFTATGDSVIWQRMPQPTGGKSSEFSHCFRWHVGDGRGKDLYESPGRFATWPRVSDGYLTIAPRVNAEDGTFYGLTAIDLDGNGKVADRLVMPQNVSPFEAVYMGGRFVFSVEANYGYGGGLGNMGTYISSDNGTYVFLSREPLACVAGKGSAYLIKAQSSHFVVDTAAQTYSVLTAPDKALDFGDYPACVGTTDRFATYATIRGDDGMPAAVRLRVFSL
ncbi:MAG: hypothetical protein Q4B77_01140 [Coriobacteriaceae bacterium]|nr:hypothetical protein [Coriobacteriaceae bacterium]